MERLYINQREIDGNLLGFLELSTDEQIAKKIYEATGDKTFKGFLPFSWNTGQIVKMRDAMERLKAAGKLSVLNMQMQVPTVSAAAHQYFISNSEKIKGVIPQNFTPGDVFKPLQPILFVAGLAAAAYLLSQLKGFIPKGRETL
jgi:hypothetical protein